MLSLPFMGCPVLDPCPFCCFFFELLRREREVRFLRKEPDRRKFSIDEQGISGRGALWPLVFSARV
jgi:hypothetical protein